MKTKLIASALIALSFASGSAFAQRGDHGNDRYDHDRNGRVEHRDNDRRDNGRYDRHDRNDRYYNAQNFRRDDHRGGGPRHDLRRGQRLSQEYRGNRYVVSDWRNRHLSAPPRGHHWVRAGNDYVLAAIATGVIAQVLLSN
ncbi:MULTISPECIES: RcnB family protein [unclassified Massilia]|uniref:RcnB family protein n=1 Tax=unclassified Massilia TaxID=2609279 RepID=UPI001783477E|nr:MULTISPECIES: RcnB family protein [unclassified Massilia]MBD8533326.1 RcnB family protein [Massilia sp. CFBP 13647]MBD8676715.1 RcnB family protein [Massilia sp. CFBP 13721]